MPRARIAVRPPNRPSNSAVTVRRMFGDAARLVRRETIPRQYTTVINWGNSDTQYLGTDAAQVINLPTGIKAAANKLTAFNLMKEAGVRVPEFCTVLPVPRSGMYLARRTLSGSGGEGIVVVREGDEAPAAPLYVKYVKKQKEFRLHVVDGEVIFVQQKKKRNGVEQTADTKLIRNYDNGWVFAIEDVVVSDDMKEQAIKAVEALGLDFGAVDAIEGKEDRLSYILEVNTAPGLSSPSLINAYKEAFLKLVDL